ncbi:DUF6585 family protein [Nocardia sp. NPDC059764]|uniref:DUF6585 family protein n=1 Tax=Nocardia sp. NPDC059764 TaxID=3346939 RepID=UPI00365C7470
MAARLGSDHGARLDWFEHGILVTTCHGARAVRFDEMRVWRRVTEGTDGTALTPMSLTYRVGTASGAAVTIPAGIPGRAQWGPALVEAAVSARLAGARARLDAGVRLEFGPFRITRTTIHGNRVALWIQVRRITVHEGLIGVWITRDGKDVLLQAYPTELVNDIDLFWTLSRDLRSE